MLILLLIATVASADDWRLHYEFYHVDATGINLKKKDFFDEDGGIEREKALNVVVGLPSERVAVRVYGSCSVADRQVVSCSAGQQGGQVRIKVDVSRDAKDTTLDISEIELEMTGYDKLPTLKHSQRYHDFKLVDKGSRIPLCRVGVENEGETLTRISILVLRFDLGR